MATDGVQQDIEYVNVEDISRSEEDQKILQSYHRLSSRRVDLVGDFAGQELFAIEGDSLLLQCFENSLLDFEEGFQMLHAVYLVEEYLAQLQRRNCRFHVAFFDAHRQLCIPQNVKSINRSKYLLTRAAIIRHLQSNLQSEDVQIHCFKDLHDQAFDDYLRNSAVYFLMCHDGARSHITQDTDVPDPRTELRSIIVHFILSGYNVALINGSEFVDTKIMAMVLETKNLSHRLDPALDASPKQQSDVSEPIPSAEINEIGTSTSSITERERLTITTLSRLIKSSSASSNMQQFTHDVLVHTALLHALPLSARSLQHTSAASDYQEHLSDFYNQAADILRSSNWTQYHQEIEGNECDVADFFDGRLFNVICKGLDLSSMPETMQSKLLKLSECLKTVCDESTIKNDADSRKLETSSLDAPSTTPTGNASVLPFSNPVFDQHLTSIRLGIDDHASEEISRPSARIFQEVSHWHNAKRPIQSKNTPVLSPRDELRARRRNQKYMDEMQKYAASLTNTVGRALEPETLLVKSAAASKVAQKSENKKTIPEPTKNADSSKKGGNPKGGKKNVKVGGKQAAQEAAAAFQAKKAEASDSKVMQAWHIILKSLSAESDLPSRYIKTKDYFASLPKDKREVLGAEVQLFSLSTLVEIAIQSGKTNDQDPNGIVAFIWHTARNLVQSDNITKTICEKIKLTVDTFGLPPVDIPKPTQDKSLPFRFALPLQSAELVKNKLSSKAFQLLHCGPFLDRSMDAAPDARVDFEPDGWQRKVLDGIDDNKSLFVVAPTSAGKTFISFYAMRKVIEADDEGVLVYVAPTKALVNQIAAEIQGRYSKKFKYPGKSVWAIHTRDHRINNATGCQVLVTVPHVLQIMLLAPSHANSWATRVKRIIFDEVHCIGQAQDGVVWEQLLLLASCPIIALSATVGNPDVFSDWLSTTEKAMGIDFEMVRHPYRYSDLRKFYYEPPKKFLFDGLGQKKGLPTLGLDGTTGFEYLHPVACLVNRSAGMPDDLSFEPRDCYTLWKAMKEHSNDKYSLPAEVDPTKALPDVIRKQDVLKWEAGLKKVLAAWMEDTASPFNAVFTTLTGKRPEKEELYAPTAKRAGQREAQEVQEDNFLPLLCRLHEQEAMPAILFNYDRTRCEDICAKIHDDLKEAEDQWKATDPKWKAKIVQWEAWKKEQERKGAKASKVSKKKPAEEGMTKADMARDAADTDANGFEGFDPAAPQDGYHFCNFKAIQVSELEDYMRELEWRRVPQWLIVALTRGVAVHHSGMNRKYRQVVEILFRKGFLRVVVATGTLALGINMPCKTVVFTGESVFLTALEYRQCAGRAGRRGFDLLGNVVFQNMQHEKVLRLMSSRLPDLNGHFPVTTTLVLRLFTLLHGSNNSKYAAACINSLLSQPRLYMGGPSFKDQTLHHLRFSIEYLRRQQLLDAKGITLNFAGLVSHLYFTENSSFAFHALLKEGYLHRLCADIDNNAESVVNTLMLVMSHLFGRVYCRKSDAEYREKVVKPSSSMVFLPPLPEEAAQVLNEHGQQTLDIFSTYVRTFVDQYVEKADDVLPLTARQVGSSSADSASGLDGVSLPSTKIRSPFVALSGHTDNFKSISELCRSVRSGVFLEESAIPHVAMLSQDLDQPLNAYLVDFFKHGDVKTLEKANGIRRGDVWFMLNDFSLVLATIITSLLNFMKLKVGSDMDFLDTMGELDTLEEAEDETVAVKEDGEAIPAPSEAPKAAMATITKKKAKKAESWEDMADEEEVIEKDYNEAAAKLDELNIDSAAWEGQGGEKGLLKVLKSFQRLHSEFNLKFKAMWA